MFFIHYENRRFWSVEKCQARITLVGDECREKKRNILIYSPLSARLYYKNFSYLHKTILPRPLLTRVIARESIGWISCGERVICLPWLESCDQLRQTCRNSRWRLWLDVKDDLLEQIIGSRSSFGRMIKNSQRIVLAGETDATDAEPWNSKRQRARSEMIHPRYRGQYVRTYAQIDLCEAYRRYKYISRKVYFRTSSWCVALRCWINLWDRNHW